MNLPGHFLADLPPEATLSPSMITEACLALRRNREQRLRMQTTAQVASIIAETARSWLREDYPFRRLALEHGPTATGFSAATLQRGLDVFFREWTLDNIQALLRQDLGAVERLDQFCSSEAEQRQRQSSIATGPELLVHILAGNIPVSGMSTLLLGLLVRSAQFLKCASGTGLFPRLLAHSLADTDPAMAACLEIAEWPGGTIALEEPLFAEADCVTATGDDSTLREIQRRLPARVRFIGHGHRVSFGFIAREALGGFARQETIDRAVDDVVAWDQGGCLSPHVFYVENGGNIAAEQFAEGLARALAEREKSQPRRSLDVRESALISVKREFYDIRASVGSATRQWRSEGSTAWTVVFETDSQFQLSCLNRFIYVKPVADLDEVLRGADAVRGQVSTVGLAGPGHRLADLSGALARWGVTRLCPLGRMQQPNLTWRHDGRPALGKLISWTNWET